MIVTALIAVISVVVSTCQALNARAWQSLNKFPTAEDYPETQLLKDRPNTAIAFTGGGSRAYIGAMGHLAGLHQLGLLKNVRYIGGISGGAWATMTYTYAQHSADDDVVLGPILQPNEITVDKLNEMDPACARSFAQKNLTLIALEAYHKGIASDAFSAWAYGVQQLYLEPAKINQNVFFSWDASTVAEIVSRNPRTLSKSSFITPLRADKPFPIIGTTLVGPAAGAPYGSKNQNYTLLEITPLYVGQMKTQDVEYKYSMGLKHTRRVGGAIESFAFGIHGDAPIFALPNDKATNTLNVPTPTQNMDLSVATGASSYAIGSFVESLRPENLTNTGMHVDYWSPADYWPKSEDTYFADGGAYENIPLISFLQRGVNKIVLFFVSSTPLQPASKWDPYHDEPSEDQMTNVLSSFFGVNPPEANWEDRSFEYEMNQVFSSEDYPKVASGLQAAQEEGRGIVATFNLTTVENLWWGVRGGMNVQITFSYLGRLKQWEAQLSTEMYDVLVPKQNVSDLSHDVESGPYKHFPHYMTMGGSLDADNANVLADLTGWQTLQHADQFRSTLSA